MINPDSRYANLETDTYENEQGEEKKYIKRRVIPDLEDEPNRGEVTLHSEDRLDHASETAFGDPKQYWRLCDANRVMNPRTMDEGDNQSLIISVPEGGA